jgi:malate dehydrogenase (oxaloacetate-decarboxylating)
MNPSAQYSFTLRVSLATNPQTLGSAITAIGNVGGVTHSVDLVHAEPASEVRDITVKAASVEHFDQILGALQRVAGVDVVDFTDRTFLVHRGGKIEQRNRVPLTTREDLSMAYTPGVARVCQAIAANRAKAYEYTIKGNTVAVVSDGTAVLGLGDVGPEAAMPVMEGKAALFKEFADIDAFPICLNTTDTDEIVEIVSAIAPGFGGINLEDISAPRCFEIEDRLKATLDIPVFHDDQHGTAIVALAALLNAVKVVDKRIEDLRVLIIGLGAAGVAVARILQDVGVTDIIGCDLRGAVHTERADYLDETMSQSSRRLAESTNPERLSGAPADVVDGTDLLIGLSAARTISSDALKRMARDPIVFAMANPEPEITPEEAIGLVRVMATGRSDYPNQINNVLAFPGIFRGALDRRASRISEEMKVAAARAIADTVNENDLHEGFIIPSVFDREVAPAVAEAVWSAATAEATEGAGVVTGRPPVHQRPSVSQHQATPRVSVRPTPESRRARTTFG